MLSVHCTRSIVNIDCAVLQHPKERSHLKIACSLLLDLPVERLLRISTRKDMWNLMMLMFSCALIHPENTWQKLIDGCDWILFPSMRRVSRSYKHNQWFSSATSQGGESNKPGRHFSPMHRFSRSFLHSLKLRRAQPALVFFCVFRYSSFVIVAS